MVFPVPMRPRRDTEEDWSDSEVLFELSFDDDDANATNFFPLPILLLPSRSTQEDKEEELRKKRHPRLLPLLVLLLVHCEEDAVRRTDDEQK